MNSFRLIHLPAVLHRARPALAAAALLATGIACAPTTPGADEGSGSRRVEQPEPVGQSIDMGFRPIEPDAPLSMSAPESQGTTRTDSSAAVDATRVAESPVVTVAAPLWLRNNRVTKLYASTEPDAHAFTDIPANSLLRVQGPAQAGRIPIYYFGDGLFRKPGNAWIEESAVTAVEAPAPGEVPAVDQFAERKLPEWVQAQVGTGLWSGPDSMAVSLTDLPRWTYLRAVGVERDGRMLVEFGGDLVSRAPGVGWVAKKDVTEAQDPGQWLQLHRASPLWSGPDARAVKFNDAPQWSKLRVVEGAPFNPNRVLVEYYGDDATRKPGTAWVARQDVGPILPPSALPKRLSTPTTAPSAAPASTNGARSVQTYTFRTEADFVNTVGEAARRSMAKTGVPASVTVAQAILESDWGRSRLARQANNLFGIKALNGPGPAGSQTFPTWEYLDGEDVVVNQPFRAYFTLEESVDDHGNFFVRNRRYAPAFAVANDARAFARAIHEAGYATDPSYSAKLIRLMDRYDLYRFDKR